jgi:PAS domain S-box-containing protein
MRQRLSGLFWALSTTLCALAVRILLDPVLGTRFAYTPFYVAATVSAIARGALAGMLATVLGGLAAIYIVNRGHGLALGSEESWFGFALYLASSSVLVILADLQRRTRLRLQAEVARRREREEELRRTAARAEEGRRTLEAVLEHLPEGLTIADGPDARIRMISRRGAEIAGRPREELLNTTAENRAAVWGLYHADGKTPPRSEELPLERAVKHGEVIANEEWTIQRPDGEQRWLLCNAAPILDSDGRVTGGLATWRDMTEFRRLKAKLEESAKVESLGVLAGGIAHDFNNLLTGILGNASLLLTDLPEGSETRAYARGVADAAKAAAKLSRQMLAYSGKGAFQLAPMDLSAYIREIQPLIESSIPEGVELRLELAAGLPLVEADAGQMQQVILNLVINGAEAIDSAGGCVTVATEPAEVDEDDIRTLLLEDNVKPGTYVAVEVRDNGAGMDEETLGRVFDPFFTTKFTGRGLGLAAVQGIVRGHKGAMKVSSTPGEGTTFRILIPAAARDDVGSSRPGGRGNTVVAIGDE